MALTAVAAFAVGVVGTLAAVRGTGEPEGPVPAVVASAPLTAYGQTPREATGDVRVFGDGRLHLHVANLPAVSGYYEVWLIDPDTMKMFSVGTVRDADAVLPLPANADLKTYRGGGRLRRGVRQQAGAFRGQSAARDPDGLIGVRRTGPPVSSRRSTPAATDGPGVPGPARRRATGG